MQVIVNEVYAVAAVARRRAALAGGSAAGFVAHEELAMDLPGGAWRGDLPLASITHVAKRASANFNLRMEVGRVVVGKGGGECSSQSRNPLCRQAAS